MIIRGLASKIVLASLPVFCLLILDPVELGSQDGVGVEEHASNSSMVDVGETRTTSGARKHAKIDADCLDK